MAYHNLATISLSRSILFTISIFSFSLSIGYFTNYAANAQGVPIFRDPNLTAKVIFTGLKFPTIMAFLGPNDIFVLEKDQGTVNRIVNGTMLPQPLLKVPIAIDAERGMTGIAITKHKNSPTYVFLYYTEFGRGKTGDDITSGIDPAGNRLYKYELVNNKLINTKLLLDLPAILPFYLLTISVVNY